MDLSSNVLYEDSDILVVNKPAGLVVHGDGRTKETSVSDWLVKKYPEAKEVGEAIEPASGPQIERPGVVHRIDRETSGVLLLAKTEEGFNCLKAQFQERSIEKTYAAFLYGKLKDDHGTINLPIGKSSSDFRKRSAERGAKGELREATTFYQVLKKTTEYTLIEAKPKTGRTHQIRVHFKALHHPVIADSLYARTKPKLLGFERLALHAREIRFTDTKGARHTVKAPYPEDFRTAMDMVGVPVLD